VIGSGFFETPKFDRQAFFWHFPGYLDGPVPRGRERLATNRAVELYNIVEDLGERHDVAFDNPDKRDELLDDLLTWYQQTDAARADQRGDASITATQSSSAGSGRLGNRPRPPDTASKTIGRLSPVRGSYHDPAAGSSR